MALSSSGTPGSETTVVASMLEHDTGRAADRVARPARRPRGRRAILRRASFMLGERHEPSGVRTRRTCRARGARRSGCSSSGTPAPSATPASVMSSAVGPRPPTVKTSCGRARAARPAARRRSRRRRRAPGRCGSRRRRAPSPAGTASWCWCRGRRRAGPRCRPRRSRRAARLAGAVGPPVMRRVAWWAP